MSFDHFVTRLIQSILAPQAADTMRLSAMIIDLVTHTQDFTHGTIRACIASVKTTHPTWAEPEWRQARDTAVHDLFQAVKTQSQEPMGIALEHLYTITALLLEYEPDPNQERDKTRQITIMITADCTGCLSYYSEWAHDIPPQINDFVARQRATLQ